MQLILHFQIHSGKEGLYCLNLMPARWGMKKLPFSVQEEGSF